MLGEVGDGLPRRIVGRAAGGKAVPRREREPAVGQEVDERPVRLRAQFAPVGRCAQLGHGVRALGRDRLDRAHRGAERGHGGIQQCAHLRLVQPLGDAEAGGVVCRVAVYGQGREGHALVPRIAVFQLGGAVVQIPLKAHAAGDQIGDAQLLQCRGVLRRRAAPPEGQGGGGDEAEARRNGEPPDAAAALSGGRLVRRLHEGCVHKLHFVQKFGASHNV